MALPTPGALPAPEVEEMHLVEAHPSHSDEQEDADLEQVVFMPLTANAAARVVQLQQGAAEGPAAFRAPSEWIAPANDDEEAQLGGPHHAGPLSIAARKSSSAIRI